MARDLSEVIGQLLSVIPESEVDLRADLVKIQSAAIYTAPELIGQRWRQAQLVLQDALGARQEEWAATCAGIFGGHTVPSQPTKAMERNEPVTEHDGIEF